MGIHFHPTGSVKEKIQLMFLFGVLTDTDNVGDL